MRNVLLHDEKQTHPQRSLEMVANAAKRTSRMNSSDNRHWPIPSKQQWYVFSKWVYDKRKHEVPEITGWFLSGQKLLPELQIEATAEASSSRNR
jgi:hypothetical protein